MLSMDLLTTNAFPGAQMMPLTASGKVFPVVTSLLNQSTQAPNAMQILISAPVQQLHQEQFVFQPKQQAQQQMLLLNQYQQQLFNNGTYRLPKRSLQLIQPQLVQQQQICNSKLQHGIREVLTCNDADILQLKSQLRSKCAHGILKHVCYEHSENRNLFCLNCKQILPKNRLKLEFKLCKPCENENNVLSKTHEKKTVESDKPQFDKNLRVVILKRYRGKRKRRNFRRVRYGVRKQIAHDKRRVGGRFVKTGSLPPTPTSTSTA